MSTAHPTVAEIRNDVGFLPLKQFIIEATGLAYYANKEDELASHVARRLVALHVASCEAYLACLLAGHAGEAELDALAASLTIGETFFFRHRELFDALRDKVFPEIIERNKDYKRIRIWSAGCSIGAEAYSLSILLRREFEQQLTGWDVSILGTDINREFLAHAQSGEFGEWSFRSSPDDLKAACFTQTSKSWTINEEYRRGVSFQYHNLVQHPIPSLVNNLSAFDLILCRNVMIYFDPQIMRQLISKFRECVVDNGWFVVGHSEPNVELFRDFHTVNAVGVVLYRRSSSSAPADTSLPWNAWTPPTFDTPANSRPSESQPTVFNKPVVISERKERPRRAVMSSTTANTLKEIRGQLDRGELKAAGESCRRMEVAERLNPLFHFYQALLAEQLGKHTETEAALRRCVYLDRGFVLGHYYLGLTLQRNRDVSSAQRCFRNVLSLLEKRDQAELFPDADGLTVGDLQRLSQMQQEVLQTP